MLWRRKHPVGWCQGASSNPGRSTFGGAPDYRMPFIFPAFQEMLKQMLLSHQTGLVLYARTGIAKGRRRLYLFTALCFPQYPESDMGECTSKGGCICSTHKEGIGTAIGIQIGPSRTVNRHTQLVTGSTGGKQWLMRLLYCVTATNLKRAGYFSYQKRCHAPPPPIA
jgi:hypothetical protein